MQTIEIGVAVGIDEENQLLVNATLRDVVLHSNGDGAWESGVLLEKCRMRPISLFVPYLSVPEVPSQNAIDLSLGASVAQSHRACASPRRSEQLALRIERVSYNEV